VGDWNFDNDPDGVVLDVSGNGNNGTPVGGPVYSTDVPPSPAANAYSMALDGVDDYVDAGTAISLAGSSFTVSFWAKRAPTSAALSVVVSHGVLGSQNQTLLLGFFSDGSFMCGSLSNKMMAPWSPDQEWHHWACSFDAGQGTRAVYRDGLRVNVESSPLYSGEGQLYIGRSTETSGRYFAGLVDDVRVYDRALAECEALELSGGIPCTTTVQIDIKPGDSHNNVTPNSNKLIAVAILSSPDFDAATVDVPTVAFGPAAASAATGSHLRDVDKDGDKDLVLGFRARDTGISPGDTQACLTGRTAGGEGIGINIEGCDAIATGK
jgi:hypothetical protein